MSLGKKLFWGRDDFLVSTVIFNFFAVFGTFKLLKILTSLRVCSDLSACTEHTGQGNRCAHSAYATRTDACTEHTSQELMHALSIRVRN